MRDLRTSGPLGSLEEKAPPNPWPCRIMCIAAVVLMVLNIIVTRFMGNHLYVQFWPYAALMILPLLLLIAAAYVFINQRLKNPTASKVMMFVGIGLGILVVSVVLSVVQVINEMSGVPVAYYSSPEKTHRLVIMRAMESDQQYAYSVYPMTSKYFYDAAAEQRVSTNTGVEEVVWESEDVALVYLMNQKGEEVCFTVDFNNPVDNTLLQEEETETEAP